MAVVRWSRAARRKKRCMIGEVIVRWGPSSARVPEATELGPYLPVVLKIQIISALYFTKASTRNRLVKM